MKDLDVVYMAQRKLLPHSILPLPTLHDLRRPHVAIWALLVLISIAVTVVFLVFSNAPKGPEPPLLLPTKLTWRAWGSVFTKGASPTLASPSCLDPIDFSPNVSAAHLLPDVVRPLSLEVAVYVQSLHAALAEAQGRLAVCLTGAAEGLPDASPWLGPNLLEPLGQNATVFVSARLDTGTGLLGPLLLRYAGNTTVAALHVQAPLLQRAGGRALSISASQQVLRHSEDEDLLRACRRMIVAEEAKMGFLYNWVLVAPLSVPWLGPIPPLSHIPRGALLMPSSSSGRLRSTSAAAGLDHPALQYSSRLGCQGYGFTALGARDSVLAAADAWTSADLNDRCCRKCIKPAWTHGLPLGVAVQAADFPICFGGVKGGREGAEGSGPVEEAECQDEEDKGDDKGASPASFWEASWKQRVAAQAYTGHPAAAMAKGGHSEKDAREECQRQMDELQKGVGNWSAPSGEAVCIRSVVLGPMLALEGAGISGTLGPGGEGDSSGQVGATIPTPLLHRRPQDSRPLVVYSVGGAWDQTWEDELAEAMAPPQKQAEDKGKKGQEELGEDGQKLKEGSGVGAAGGTQRLQFFRFSGSVTQLKLNSCREEAGERVAAASKDEKAASCFPQQSNDERVKEAAGGKASSAASSTTEQAEARTVPELTGSLREVLKTLDHKRIDILKALASPSEGFSLIPFQDKRLPVCLLLLTTASKDGFAPTQLVESLRSYSYELAGCSVCTGSVPALCCAWYSMSNCL